MLKSEFAQRKIGKTGQSFRRQIPLSSPSGAQWVESELEANAVIQIAFVPTFYDLISQPIINYAVMGKKRVYTPDIACIFQSVEEPFPGRFIIETKPRSILERDRAKFEDGFHAAREMCKDMGAAFRILHEGHLNTAYLRNAILLRKDLGRDPDFNASDLLQAKFGTSSFTRRDGQHAIEKLYREPWEASEAINVLIAWREVACDLTQDICDDSELLFYPKHDKRWRADPFLKMLQTMDSEVNI